MTPDTNSFPVPLSTTFIPAMSQNSIRKLDALDEAIRFLPQEKLGTDHLFHAGVYARTVELKAGSTMVGALLKIATVLIVSGHVLVYLGEEYAPMDAKGYHVLPGFAGRKGGFYAIEDTMLTMIFATDAKTVQEAEDEFTDQGHRLMSRQADAVNNIIITGE